MAQSEFAVDDVTSGLLTWRSLQHVLNISNIRRRIHGNRLEKFVLSSKQNCQEVDSDDYCAVREKDIEYLKREHFALLSRTVIVKVMVAMVTRLDK